MYHDQSNNGRPRLLRHHDREIDQIDALINKQSERQNQELKQVKEKKLIQLLPIPQDPDESLEFIWKKDTLAPNLYNQATLTII